MALQRKAQIVIFLASALLLVVVAMFIERGIEARRFERILVSLAAERRELADRIQHPEIRQVQPGEPVTYEQSKDTEEMAHVGQIVPEFVQVGSEED